MLWLAESDYGAPDGSSPTLALSPWAQYFLDSFATVAEAVASLENQPLQLVAQRDPVTERDVTVHLALDDASGDSAIIEYLDGKASIHHGRETYVLTNSPPYEQQVEHLRASAVTSLYRERPTPRIGSCAPPTTSSGCPSRNPRARRSRSSSA